MDFFIKLVNKLRPLLLLLGIAFSVFNIAQLDLNNLSWEANGSTYLRILYCGIFVLAMGVSLRHSRKMKEKQSR